MTTTEAIINNVHYVATFNDNKILVKVQEVKIINGTKVFNPKPIWELTNKK